MGAIFLSYSRDDRACAEALARVLERAGHEVWWDRRIESGEEFAAEIEAALDRADLVLVAWSAHSGKSPWVRDEAATGRDEGRLLPVSIDGSRPPMGFRQYQTLDLTGWKGGNRDRRTAELLESVERRLKTKGEVPPHPAAKARPFARSSAAYRGRLWAAAAALILAIGIAAALLIPRLYTRAEPASLAVLPFRNMSAGDPYFAEGVAEEISDRLSREPQFRVTGRTSADLFKDAADLRDVGRRLHVAYVLEGSVRAADKQVRVDVSLIETRKGVRLWTEDFSGSLDDMFAIQDRIGEQVAAHVRRQLISEVASSTMKTSGDVYALYVTARSLMRQREPGKIDAAVDLLKRAVKLDPNYAPAWARLGLAEQLSEFYGGKESTEASRAEQIRYAEHAIALAPKLADAHAILGLFLSGRLNAQETRRARRELENAVRLDPGNAEAWYWLAELHLTNLEFNGALDALRRTATIDPFFVHSQHFPPLAWEMGDRDEAVRVLDNRIANSPDPFMREIARAQLAHLHFDLARDYEYSKAARDVAPADLKDVAEGRMGAVLLQLDLLDAAERLVPTSIVDLRRGQFTFPKRFNEGFPDAAAYWQFSSDEEHWLPRVLVKTGRSSELVLIYDRAFKSPEDMAARYSRNGFVLNAPLLAIALHEVGRGREGAHMIVIADGMCRNAVRGLRTPLSFQVECSRVAALMGRSDEAIGAIQQAVGQGWRPTDGEYPAVTDEPAYAAIRNDPRLKRIDAIIGADIERERRKLLASGI
jgi:adenylate cyclase